LKARALIFAVAWLGVSLAAPLLLTAQKRPVAAAPRTELFSRLDSMLREVESIMGLKAKKPIAHEVMTRDQINELVGRRLDEGTSSEEISQEEIFLKLFGFVGDDFDLAEQVVEVLTEQATALYDYRSKKLYLATWASPEMQEYALVHELAHAVADQHFDLERFVSKGRTADEDLARSAVIEGQASWVMTEWVMRKSDRSLKNNRMLAVAAAGGSRYEVEKYPVYSSSPEYIRETMLFPYTDGLIFQQYVVEEYGKEAFSRVFEKPPTLTQHILEPATYFAEAKPQKTPLPALDLDGYERTSKGDVGQLDHRILVRQYLGEDASESATSGWRGARYEIWANQNRDRHVLRYASQWETADDAKRFFDAYVRVLEEKWDRFEVHRSGPKLTAGAGDNGAYRVQLDGTVVSSVEGLPEGRLESAFRKPLTLEDGS